MPQRCKNRGKKSQVLRSLIHSALFSSFRYILHFDFGRWLTGDTSHLERPVHQKQRPLSDRKGKNIIRANLSRLSGLRSGKEVEITNLDFITFCEVVWEHFRRSDSMCVCVEITMSCFSSSTGGTGPRQLREFESRIRATGRRCEPSPGSVLSNCLGLLCEWRIRCLS